ncbi:MAG: hypothetical protein LBQ91_00260 [Oscillospiraceae bacterium]|jgi:hypothetical protein|nr:hypothetical protein [Oscillospiraceae bacterium]
MKKIYLLAALLLLCAVLFSCGKPEPSATPEQPAVSETPTTTETPASEVNIVDTLSEEEYRGLNEFLHDLTRLSDKDGETVFPALFDSGLKLLRFAFRQPEYNYNYWYYHYYYKSAAEIEEELKRYFGVEKVKHESYGSIEISDPFEEARYSDIFTELPVWFGYRNSEYRLNFGYSYGDNISSVSEYYDNGDGTFTARVDIYKYNNYNWPDNWRDAPADKWFLVKPTQTLTIGDAADGEFDLTKTETITVGIRPYEESYQIVSINGKAAPKEITFAGISEEEKFPESLRKSVFNLKDQVALIKDAWTQTQEAIKAKEYTKDTYDYIPHVVYYSFPNLDGITRIDVQKGYGGEEYSRIYIFKDYSLIFAYWSGEDAHRIYYFNGYAFRYAYTPVGGEQVTYDLDFSGADFQMIEGAVEAYDLDNARYPYDTSDADYYN